MLTIALSIGMILATTGLLWMPYFAHFSPQQNKIMWVLPTVRTMTKDYFAIYGFFLSVLIMSFAVAYSKELGRGIIRGIKRKVGWEDLQDQLLKLMEQLISPANAVQGMVSLGLASLAVIWGASWAHWAEPPEKTTMLIQLIMASLASVVFVAAIYFKKRWEFWAAEAAIILIWVGIITLHLFGIHFVQDMSFTLDLGLFSVLWILAFFHLGFGC